MCGSFECSCALTAVLMNRCDCSRLNMQTAEHAIMCWTAQLISCWWLWGGKLRRWAAAARAAITGSNRRSIDINPPVKVKR